MDYTSTLSFQTAYDPAIRVTLHKPSYGRRINLDKMTTEFRSRVRVIQKKYKKVQDSLDQANREFEAAKQQSLANLRESEAFYLKGENQPLVDLRRAQIADTEASQFQTPDDAMDELQDLNAEALRVTAQDYNPQLLRWGVASIEGLEVDGQPAGVEELIANGPPALVHELVSRIEDVRGMNAEQLKNSSLPSISSEAEDGNVITMTAISASNPASTSAETAGESIAIAA